MKEDVIISYIEERDDLSSNTITMTLTGTAIVQLKRGDQVRHSCGRGTYNSKKKNWFQNVH